MDMVKSIVMLAYKKRKCFLLTLSICVIAVYIIHSSVVARMDYGQKLSNRFTTATPHPITKKTKTTKPHPLKHYQWLEQSSPMMQQEEDIFRCKAVDMGSFTVVNNFEPTKMKSLHPSREECLDTCFESSNNYAGFQSKTGLCYCNYRFNYFLTTNGMDSATSADKAKNNGENSVRVYKKIRDCEKGLSEESLKFDRIGCMAAPLKLNAMMISLTMSGVSNQQCVLNCELRRFTIAVPVKSVNACLCSDSFSLFKTADNMYRIMQGCSDDNLEATSSGKVPVFRTGTPDNHCGPKRFLKPGQAPATLLASFYGSGNTWLRHLIEEATGIYTGSVYRDDKLYRGGLIGEKMDFNSGRVIVIKDHLFNLKVKHIYKSAILLLRNPYDATLAEYTRMTTRNHTGLLDPEIYKTEKFKNYSKAKAKYWLEMPTTLLREMKSVLVVYYEDIVLNPVEQLRRIVRFLPRGLMQSAWEDVEKRLMCMNLDLQGDFKRPPKKLDFSPFTVAARNAFDTAIRQMDELMKKYKQPPLPEYYFKM